MNYYPFHIGDFRSGTVNMSRQARWIYRDMMDVYYDAEAPLPLDIDVLCDALGVEAADERAIVERLLRFKFIKTDGGYRHEVCEQVIAEYQAKAETAKANGKKSAATRYQNGQYMPGEGVMYAVRVSPATVKVGVTANMKSRLHQLRSKYGKQAFVLHQVAVACMGDAEGDLLAEYADVRSGEEFPVEVAQEPLLISAMNRIQVAYQVASVSHAGSPTRSHTNQEPITNNHKPVNLKPSSASPPEPYPEEFETAWQAYPPRPGASKKDSYKGWTARRKEGVSTEALLAGVQRYANYVLLSRTEPQFTKQPATFFGPGEHYPADGAVGATQTQTGVIHGKFGKQDYHKGVGADGTF